MLAKQEVKGYVEEFEGVVQESLYSAEDYRFISGVANGQPIYIHRRNELDLTFLAMQPRDNHLKFVVHNHEGTPDEGIIPLEDGETIASLRELDFEGLLNRMTELKVKAHTYYASEEGGSLLSILHGEALSDAKLGGHYKEVARAQFMDFVCTVMIVWLGFRHTTIGN